MWLRAFTVGFRVFPSRGKSMYIVYIWPTGVAGGRAVPPDVREERGGLYTSFFIGSHCLAQYGCIG